MATNITHALRQIKEDLDAHLTPTEIQTACQACGHQWRDRVLGPVPSLMPTDTTSISRRFSTHATHPPVESGRTRASGSS